MVQPLDFSKIVQKTPSDTVPPVAPIAQDKPRALDFSTIQRPTSTPVVTERLVAQPQPTKLDFGNIAPVVSVQPTVPKNVGQVCSQGARSVFIDPTDTQVPDIMSNVKQLFPKLSKTELDRVLILVKQLTPLTHTIAATWGEKVLADMVLVSADVTRAVKEIANTRGLEVLENAKKALVDSPSIVQRFLRKDSVRDYQPRLVAIRTKVQRWVSQIDSLVSKAKKSEQDLIVNAAAYFGVLQYLGAMPDQSLEQAATMRRSTLHQATTQATLNVASVEQLKTQLITLSSALDHFLSVTIPAYESAKSRY